MWKGPRGGAEAHNRPCPAGLSMQSERAGPANFSRLAERDYGRRRDATQPRISRGVIPAQAGIQPVASQSPLPWWRAIRMDTGLRRYDVVAVARQTLP